MHDNDDYLHDNDDHNYQLTRDRNPRVRIPNRRYNDSEYVLFTHDFNMVEYAFLTGDVVDNPYTPHTYKQAMNCSQSKNWKLAMQDEIDSMIVNKTWVLIAKPENAKLVPCKWIYKLKEATKLSEPPRYKARLVAKGFTQREGIDYTDIFAPVVKYKTLRLLLAFATVHDWDIEQMDVKTAFLHGNLDETIYMKQPEGFVDKSKPDHVCLLKKSIYGLKQSPRQWNLKFDECMKNLGFLRSNYDYCLYFKGISSMNPLFVLLYVGLLVSLLC